MQGKITCLLFSDDNFNETSSPTTDASPAQSPVALTSAGLTALIMPVPIMISFLCVIIYCIKVKGINNRGSRTQSRHVGTNANQITPTRTWTSQSTPNIGRFDAAQPSTDADDPAYPPGTWTNDAVYPPAAWANQTVYPSAPSAGDDAGPVQAPAYGVMQPPAYGALDAPPPPYSVIMAGQR